MTILPKNEEEKLRWRSQRAAVNKLLNDEWDPIGVRGIGDHTDEYQNYASVATMMAREGASVFEISNYLNVIAREYIGLSRYKEEKSVLIAEKVLLIMRGRV